MRLSACCSVLSTALTLLVDRGAGSLAVRAGGIVNEVVGFVVVAIAFAALLRVLPDRPPRGRRVWIGAVASAVLFAAGKYVLGWYVTHFALGSAYGAAGTVVVLMLWIYFSAATFLAGAVLASEMVLGPRRTPPGDEAARESTPGSVARKSRIPIVEPLK